jgi:predicted GIY-YIG superfamily endonuclease
MVCASSKVATMGRPRHYLGFTHNLEQRLEDHRRGTACATTKVAFDRGIGSLGPHLVWYVETEASDQGVRHGQLLSRLPDSESAPSNLIGANGLPWEGAV